MVIHRATLDNGLRIVHCEDNSTQMVALNMAYNVGARDEHPDHTGFAHLFEHLMFGGSEHIPDFDTPLQQGGGENNAWTNNDLTNYYLTVPYPNVETAFWLESDRMLQLAFSEKSLDVQRGVVVEEFKQRYLNQPYGDVFQLIRAMAYKIHPYRWSTIGLRIEHIEQATLQEVREFFFNYYAPDNAVLAVTGHISFERVMELAWKWFAPIPRRNVHKDPFPAEPEQTEERRQEVVRPVPLDALYMAFHMAHRTSPDYYAADALSDILSNGKSSRLEQRLCHEQKICSSIDAYVGGSIDPGLFHITAKPAWGRTIEEVEQAVWRELRRLQDEPVSACELEKVKNHFESDFTMGSLNYLNVATNLAYFELLSFAPCTAGQGQFAGGAPLINSEVARYRRTTAEDLQRVALTIFQPGNCSTLYYRAARQ